MKKALIFGIAILILSALIACGNTSTTTQSLTSTAPIVTAQTLTSANTTTNATYTTPTVVKPQGELVAAFTDLGNENFLPWAVNAGASQLCDIVYDVLIYFDVVNREYFPGLAEKWELSSDGLTLTYHLRKGVQFQDGWGEFTAEDVKFTFEKHASPQSVGKTTASRQIKSMEIPDPYTLVVHFKNPSPTFFMNFALSEGGMCQGIVSKKYVETVGEEEAAQKPIGTGPYKLIEGKLGDHYKFEAADSHWRVVPEFKYVIARIIPEISTTVAMLKTGEVDLSPVSSEQMADLKAAGLATEASKAGGVNFQITWGGLAIPEDKRYNADYHNKDPWVDMRVRKAMTIAIDRQAICDAIFKGGAFPTGVPLFTPDMEKYKYPFDQAAAKQLLVEAGYPDGFKFDVYSYVLTGVWETPRVMEALAGYWQQIGLKPNIVSTDRPTFDGKHRKPLKMAGELSPMRLSSEGDFLDNGLVFFIPNAPASIFMDEGSYAIWKEGSVKVDLSERAKYADKLQKYWFENYGPLPVVRIVYSYAWNSKKIAPFPHSMSDSPYYLEYVRHAQPLNTFRLFSPWPDR